MKILIGYDGSECSDLALEDLRKAGLPAEAEAVVLAVGEAWGMPVAVDRVSAGSEKFIHPTTRLVEQHLKEVVEGATRFAERAVERLKVIFPDWSIMAEAVCGKPAAELIKKADEWSPELLVVGSHGRTAIGRAVLGSVSSKVLHEARCSMRISRKNEYAAHSNTRILVAVDGSEEAQRVARTVAARSWTSDTEIRLIAVDDPFGQPAGTYVLWDAQENQLVDNEGSREWIERVIDGPLQDLRRAGLQTSHNIRWGDAANMILEEAAEWKADTIFVGARGLGRVKRFLLGSVSSTVAAKAKCSVEVVR